MSGEFFTVFEYTDMYDCGGDYTINFDDVTIIRDIPQLNLMKGMSFETCWFNLKNQTFHFIVWNKKPSQDGSYNPNPETSRLIAQSDLAEWCAYS